jgi:uncharacterized protein YggE
MGYLSDSEIIQAAAKGSAETIFTGATYRATVTCSARTGPDAKKAALPAMQKVRAVIEAHAKAAGLDTEKVRTTFSVDVETHRGTGEFAGYKATWTCKFRGSDVRSAPEVHDALTSIDGVQAPTPIYHVDDSAEVHARAFSDAVKKAQANFENQCRALGHDPKDFFVRSWMVSDDTDRGGGKTLSYKAPVEGAFKAVGLEPGKASLEVDVTLGYSRRPTLSSR